MTEFIDAIVELDGATIPTRTWNPVGASSSAPQMVFLHDGLGSVAQWRDVPAAVADRTGSTVLAYDRPGHGASTPVPTGPWPAHWLRSEADRLDRILDAVGADQPLLIGHSDGGSIALLHAAHHRAGRGVVAIAAHAWLEAEAVRAIQQLRDASDVVVEKLGRHHAHPRELFEAWSGVWTGVDFSTWDIRPDLASITVPCHIIQGDDDEYGTSRQATDTATVIGSNATCTMVPAGHHLLHHEHPELVAEMVCAFWEELCVGN